MLAARWLVAFFACCALSCLAQETQPNPAQSHGDGTTRLIPRSAEERERASQASHHIIFDVAVTDTAEHPVPGLTASDFTVLAGGQSQTITSFRILDHDDNQPPHAILLLDAENNSTHNYGDQRKAVEKFLAQSHGALPLPVAIAYLSDSGMEVQPASRDANVLLSEVRALPREVHETGSTNTPYREMETGVRTAGSLPATPPSVRHSSQPQEDQNQRFLLSIAELEKLAVRQQEVPGRVIVIWIGPGWPLLNGPGFRPDTPAVQSSFFDHMIGISTEIRVAQMTLNAVSSPDTLRDAGLPKDEYNSLFAGVTAPAQASAGHLSLQVLAVQSGGQVLDHDKDVAAEIAQCLAGAASRYQLSFESSPSTQPEEYRPIEVKVDRAGVTVRTNAGYYAEP